MGIDVRNLDWQLARDHFKGHTNLANGEVSYLSNIYKYQDHGVKAKKNSNSFVNFGSKIYKILPEIAGEGNFGIVRYARSPRGKNNYVVKISNDPVTIKDAHLINNEIKIAKDVGLVIDSGKRRRQKYNYLSANIQYSVMPDLGSTLGEHLSENTPIEERFSLAIQLCLSLCRHHFGHATSSGKKVVHRDIKPANIMVKDISNKLSLADYGLAQYSDPNAFVSGSIGGTPYYLTYMTSYASFNLTVRSIH